MKRFLCSLLFILFSFISASAQRVYVLYTNGVPTNCVTGNLYVDKTTGNIYSWKLGIGCIISGNVNGVSGSGVSGRISYWNGVSSLTSITGFTFDGLNLSIPTGGQFTINGTAFNFSNLAGNINVSQMNSGTSASSTTFWRGDGTWATPVSVNPTSGNIPYNNGGLFSDSLLSQSGGNVTLASGQFLASVGSAALPTFAFTGSPTTGIYAGGADRITFGSSGVARAQISGNEFRLESTQILGWGTAFALDTTLVRDAANTLALRNSTNPQTFRVYNTFTDTSNYERGIFSWAGNILKIGTEAAGTGTVKNINLVGGSVTITSSANALALTGGSSYGTSAAGWYVAAKSGWDSAVDGNIRLVNFNNTGFGLLQFGGTTSSFPAIKRNATAINFRLADDSADASITALTGTFSSTINATGYQKSGTTLSLSGVLSMGNSSGQNISGAATSFNTFGVTNSAGITTFSVTENTRQLVIPVTGTLTNFYIITNSGQPADGSLVCTIRINSVNTSIVATVAAGTAAGTFSDTTHTASITAGSLLSYQCTNNSPATGSAALTQWAIAIQ